MDNINFPAVRAVCRIMCGTKKEFLDREKGEAADRMFDCGEWSDSIQDERHDRREQQVISAVAKRFGITEVALYHDMYAARYHHDAYFFKDIGVL